MANKWNSFDAFNGRMPYVTPKFSIRIVCLNILLRIPLHDILCR